MVTLKEAIIMKKFMFSLLIVTFVVLSSSISYAANWQWIDSNDKVGYFFDSDTIRYEEKIFVQKGESPIDFTQVTCFVKQTFTQEAIKDIFPELDHTVDLYTFSLSNRTITRKETICYDRHGAVLYSDKKISSSNVLPDTWGESMFNCIRDYARRHHDELIEHTHGD